MDLLDEDQCQAITDYMCGHCHSNSWALCIIHLPGGRTLLSISCSSDKCKEQERIRLSAAPDSAIVWEEFDISNQGYDIIDESGCDPSEGNNDRLN